jgi:GT2 family glycosyltransferase
MSIPVIAIPVLNRADLFMRCVRSIDFPVDKLVIINNGSDPGIRQAIEQLGGEHDFNILVHQPGFNKGVAASWNWVMRNVPAEYWLIVGSDIQFTRGDLAKIDAFVRAHPDYVMCPANWGHSLFAIRPSCVEGAGYFDENFYPAYSEDVDHCRRINLAGLPWADVPDVHAVHGEPPLWGSSTVWSDPVLNRKCSVSQRNNAAYYKSKWGGDPGKEIFLTPFNDPDLTVKDCPIDADLLKANGHPEYQ